MFCILILLEKSVLSAVSYDILPYSELVYGHKTGEKHVKHDKAWKPKQQSGRDHFDGSLCRDKQKRRSHVRHYYKDGGGAFETPRGRSVQTPCKNVEQGIHRTHRYVKHGGDLVGQKDEAQHTAYSRGAHGGASAAFSVKNESQR